jgi:ATP-binding protein involved in chromosome partitioning
MQSQVEALAQSFEDPYLQCSWSQARVPLKVCLLQEVWEITATLGYPTQACQEEIHSAFLQWMKKHLNEAVKLQLKTDIRAHTVQPGVANLTGIKNIIAVGSGKGGVGKSTTAINLAVALVQEGAKVGLLDADIYGPNQPTMLGVQQTAKINQEKQLIPIEQHGLLTMSMGYLVARESPMIWRGPMVTSALLQMLQQSAWGDLDYLIIDLPPGTGDIQLTLAQKVPVSAAIIVTTPQDVAHQDARKGLEMLRKVNIPVLGIIENMSMHTCSKCGHQDTIFGEGGGQELAEACEVELLGRVPLDKEIRKHADKGSPMVLAHPETAVAALYQTMARRIVAKLSLQPKSYAAKMPPIIVENL